MLNEKLEIGIKYFENGEYEKSLEIFNDLIESDNKNQTVIYYKANVLGALKRYEEAILLLSDLCSSKDYADEAKYLSDLFNVLKIKSNKYDIENLFILEEKPTWPCQELYEINKSSASPGGDNEYKVSTDIIGTVPICPAPASNMPKGESGTKSKKDNLCNNLNKPKDNETTFLASILSGLDFSNSELRIYEEYKLNKYDEKILIEFTKKKQKQQIIDFLVKVALRAKILKFLGDSNILPPRKYNTIIDQINNTNAEFAVAYILFNIGEDRYNDIFKRIGEDVNNHKTSFLQDIFRKIKEIFLKPGNEQTDKRPEKGKIGIFKIISKFFIILFGFEKSFVDEKHKLTYFKYLFIFLGFIGILVLLGYSIKTMNMKADVRSESISSSGMNQKTFELHTSQ